MSLAVPTTQDVSDTIVAQLEASLAQTIPFLPKTFCRVLAKVLAGVVVILYKYAGFTFLQLFVAHASFQPTTVNGQTVVPLVLWGRLIGVGDPGKATRAELSLSLAVTSITGKILAGQQFLNSATQITYQAITETVITSSPVFFTVRATYDQNDTGGAGAAGNMTAGDTLQVANGPPNAVSTALVVAQTVTGANAESADAYRAKIIRRFQQRPQGGAFADYRLWAEEVPGIVHAYPYRGAPGVVDVYIEADETSSGSADGIPTGAQLAAVLANINLDQAGVATRRPVSAAPNVLPISRTGVDITISGLSVSDMDTVKDEIQAGADEHLRSREPFIVGLSVLPRLDRVTIAALGGIIDGIVAAAGGTITAVSFSVSGIQQTAITLGPGEKAKLAGPPLYV